MRKNVFSSSIKILIVSLLLLAVFFQKERSQKLMALALILWGAVTAGIFLFRKSGKLAKKCGAFFASLRQTGKTAKTATDTPAEAEPETEPASPAKPVPDSRETDTMLLHISLRITEKLKSAYPPVCLAVEGHTLPAGHPGRRDGAHPGGEHGRLYPCGHLL